MLLESVIYSVFWFIDKEVYGDEDDIPAEKKVKGKGSWIPQADAHGQRQKSSGCQKSKRKT